MLKKLSEEQLEWLLEAGVEEFARHGPAGANMRAIADRAGRGPFSEPAWTGVWRPWTGRWRRSRRRRRTSGSTPGG